MLEKYQLPNGMKVILFPQHKAPVVTVQAWVRTGSADELKGEEGISHFIEHLLFKGTKKYKVGEIAALVEGSGGELNAYTSFDQTVFHVTISKEFTGVALDTVNEMIGYPTFDKNEIDNEREVVIEEIKRSNDNPHRASSRLLFEGVYPKHPYGKPVIGYEENIRTFSPELIKKYYKSRYSPKNISLVVVGDFNKEQIKKEIKESFAKIPATPIRKSKRTNDPIAKTYKTRVEETPFQETLCHIAWKIPGAKHADTPAVDLLAAILGQGESSRLWLKARLSSPITNYVGAHVYSPNDDGFFAVSSGLKLENLEEYLTSVGEELLRVTMEPVSEEEIKKVVTLFEAEEIYGVETVDGLARKLGTFELLFNKPDFYTDYLEKMIKVNANDILRVARKYIRADNMSISITTKSEKARAQKIVDKFAHDFALALDALKKAPIEKVKGQSRELTPMAIKSTEQKKLVVHESKLGDAKIFIAPATLVPSLSMRIAFRGGQRVEPDGQDGITEFLSRVWLSGTKKHKEIEILERMDMLAMGLKPFAGRNTVGLSLKALAPTFEAASDIFFECVADPIFDQEIIERERELMLETLRQRQDNPATIAIQKFHEEVFRGHPYAKDTAGTKETIQNITRENIEQHWKKMVSRNNACVALVGDAQKDKVLHRVETGLKRLTLGARIDNKFEAQPLVADKYCYEKLEKEQSHIVYGVRGLTMYDKDRLALNVMDAILSGQGGRLFFELRDKASLAYTVSPIGVEGLDLGYFGAYIGCSPEKGAKAISMLEDEFKKLVETQVSESEIERAKRYLIGSHDIGLQKNSSLCSGILFEEIYDISYKNMFNYSERVRAVTAEDVRRLAERLFSQKRVVVAVGPTQPW